MSDNTTHHQPAKSRPSTLAELLDGLEPMGDLSRFAIDDLSLEEWDQFGRILEDA